jgi:hypothetical protein
MDSVLVELELAKSPSFLRMRRRSLGRWTAELTVDVEGDGVDVLVDGE